jgi:hypothetical protein
MAQTFQNEAFTFFAAQKEHSVTKTIKSTWRLMCPVFTASEEEHLETNTSGSIGRWPSSLQSKNTLTVLVVSVRDGLVGVVVRAA